MGLLQPKGCSYCHFAFTVTVAWSGPKSVPVRLGLYCWPNIQQAEKVLPKNTLRAPNHWIHWERKGSLVFTELSTVSKSLILAPSNSLSRYMRYYCQVVFKKMDTRKDFRNLKGRVTLHHDYKHAVLDWNWRKAPLSSFQLNGSSTDLEIRNSSTETYCRVSFKELNVYPV